MEQPGVLAGPIVKIGDFQSYIKFHFMGNPEVVWFKSHSRYFFLINVG